MRQVLSASLQKPACVFGEERLLVSVQYTAHVLLGVSRKQFFDNQSQFVIGWIPTGSTRSVQLATTRAHLHGSGMVVAELPLPPLVGDVRLIIHLAAARAHVLLDTAVAMGIRRIAPGMFDLGFFLLSA